MKGDASGDEISIDFIKNLAQQKSITLDLNEFDKIYIAENEKALRNQKQTRRDNTIFIELSNMLKGVPKTDNSHRYSFKLNSEKFVSNFIEGIYGEKLKSKALHQNHLIFFYSFSGNSEKNLTANILKIAVKSKEGKYEFKSSAKMDDECILVLDFGQTFTLKMEAKHLTGAQ